MKHLTITQLKDMLRAQKGATPVTIEALTDARARKTDNPFDKIFKLSTVNGFTGFDYEASVNRQQVREGNDPTFEAQDRSWGTNLNNVLVELKGKFYIAIRPLNSVMKPIYFGEKNGKLNPVEKKDIEKFLPAPVINTNQGTDKEIVYRNYSLESLRKITIKGETYEVVQ